MNQTKADLGDLVLRYLGLQGSSPEPQKDWTLPPAPQNNKLWKETWEAKHEGARDIHTAFVLIALYSNFTHVHTGKKGDATLIKHPVPDSNIRLDEFDVNFGETQADTDAFVGMSSIRTFLRQSMLGILKITQEQMHGCKASAEQFLVTCNKVLAATPYAKKWAETEPRRLVRTYHTLYELVANFFYERKLLSRVTGYKRDESMMRRGWPLRRYEERVDLDILALQDTPVPSPSKAHDRSSEVKTGRLYAESGYVYVSKRGS